MFGMDCWLMSSISRLSKLKSTRLKKETSSLNSNTRCMFTTWLLTFDRGRYQEQKTTQLVGMHFTLLLRLQIFLLESKLKRTGHQFSEGKNAISMRELSADARRQVWKNSGEFFSKTAVPPVSSDNFSTEKASCSSILLVVRFFGKSVK